MNNLETIVLDNGLTVYLYLDQRRHSTFFQFNTLCGGLTKHFRYDGKDISLQDGVAHILEHYIVECNEKGNFLEELGHKQMATNASTSPFVTNYYFETVENVLFGIRTMLEGIYHVPFTKEKLEKLKNPIYQEVRGKLDNKFYHANRVRLTNLFNHIDFRDVGGTLEEIEKTTVQDIETFYHAFYQPYNQFIVIAGNFNKEEVIQEIKNFYQNTEIEKHEVSLIPYLEEKEIVKSEDSFEFSTPLPYAELSFKLDVSHYSSEELLDLDFYLHSFYSSSFGTTSVLHKQLIDQKIINDYIQYGDVMIENYIIISIGAYTNDSKKFKKAVLEEIKNLQHLDEEKFELDKKNSIVQIILRDENIFKMIMPFINNIIFYHYPYLDTVDDVVKLTYQQYKDVIHSLDFSQFTYLEIQKPKL